MAQGFIKDHWTTTKALVFTISGNLVTAPVDSTPYYVGNMGVVVAAPLYNNMFIPVNGVIKKIYIKQVVAGTLGTTAQNCTFNLRVNNTTDYLIGSMDQDAILTDLSNTSLNIGVSSGDYFEIKVDTPAWTTNPTNVYWAAIVYMETA